MAKNERKQNRRNKQKANMMEDINSNILIIILNISQLNVLIKIVKLDKKTKSNYMLLTSIKYRKVESKIVENDTHANYFKELFWLSEGNKSELWAKKTKPPKMVTQTEA